MAPKRQVCATVPEGEPVLRVARTYLDTEIGDSPQRGQQLLQRPVQTTAEVDELRSALNTWDEFNEHRPRSPFSTGEVADAYRRVGIATAIRHPQAALDWVRRDISNQRRKLESIRAQLPLYETDVEENDMQMSTRAPAIDTPIFVVHGHDGDTKYPVVEFLETVTDERPVVLHEQPDSGRTIIGKFEQDHLPEAGSAVVLLTADDLGRSKPEIDLNSRARQNVVLELGFFTGSLRRGRIVALHESDAELPSDLQGLLYKRPSGNWQTELAGELIAAKIHVNKEKLVWP